MHHLKVVFEVLRENRLLAKVSKCSFGKKSMGFLGHIIKTDSVHPDSEKIKAMVEWPIPTNIKQLRGFLGLTGYYRKFIRGYAQIAAPMTDLLKKDFLGLTDYYKKFTTFITFSTLVFLIE